MEKWREQVVIRAIDERDTRETVREGLNEVQPDKASIKTTVFGAVWWAEVHCSRKCYATASEEAGAGEFSRADCTSSSSSCFTMRLFSQAVHFLHRELGMGPQAARRFTEGAAHAFNDQLVAILVGQDIRRVPNQLRALVEQLLSHGEALIDDRSPC